MAAKPKKKKLTQKQLEVEAQRLQHWEDRLKQAEERQDRIDERRAERQRVEDEDRRKKADELKEREFKVGQAERDAEVGQAVRLLGRALLEGAFGDPADGSRGRRFFGPPPFWGGW